MPLIKKEAIPWRARLRRWWKIKKGEMRWYKWRAFEPRWFHEFRYFIKDSIWPHNVIKIETLDKSFQETETLLLHGSFQMLVDFVKYQWDDGKSKYFGHLFDLVEEEKKYREEYKEWDEEFIQANIAQLRLQNEGTQEIWDLYNWWTKTRPARKSPYDSYTGPQTNYEFKPVQFDKDGDPEFYEMVSDKSPEYEKMMDEEQAFDDACEKEDEEMMIRLIKIRRHLWT